MTELDPERKVAVIAGGRDMPYDLFLGVPVRRAPAVVEASGLCVDGWIPVDPRTLETAFVGVDHSAHPTEVTYDGRGEWYPEFGRNEVAKVDVTFQTGAAPTGTFEAASSVLAEPKHHFGTSRIQRWCGREWEH